MGHMKEWALNDDGFTPFLQEIVDSEGLEGAALGITKLVIDKGRETLSPKQEYVFQTQVLDEYTVDECKRCSGDIPWCEMMAAYENGGYCGWCTHMMNKDD
jgi:hypothetical protein